MLGGVELRSALVRVGFVTALTRGQVSWFSLPCLGVDHWLQTESLIRLQTHAPSLIALPPACAPVRCLPTSAASLRALRPAIAP